MLIYPLKVVVFHSYVKLNYWRVMDLPFGDCFFMCFSHFWRHSVILLGRPWYTNHNLDPFLRSGAMLNHLLWSPWHIAWHVFWHSIRHSSDILVDIWFSHRVWHLNWHSIWHFHVTNVWHSIWHLIWHFADSLSGILSGIPSGNDHNPLEVGISLNFSSTKPLIVVIIMIITTIKSR